MTPQPQQLQQHQHYHQAAQNWRVARTRLREYPQQSQEAIIAGNGRKGSGSGRTAAPRPSNRPSAAPVHPTQQHDEHSVHDAQVQQLLAVLAYEQRHGYGNCVGSRGERFSAWASHTCQQLSLQAMPPHSAAAAHLIAAAQQLSGYGAMAPPARAALVNQATAAATAAQAQLAAPSRAQRAQRSGDSGPAASQARPLSPAAHALEPPPPSLPTQPAVRQPSMRVPSRTPSSSRGAQLVDLQMEGDGVMRVDQAALDAQAEVAHEEETSAQRMGAPGGQGTYEWLGSGGGGTGAKPPKGVKAPWVALPLPPVPLPPPPPKKNYLRTPAHTSTLLARPTHAAPPTQSCS
jgi:hypothetical protein